MSKINTCFSNDFIQDTDLSYKAKLVYIVMKSYWDFRDPTKPVWPKISRISEQSGLSMTCVKQGLKELQEKAYIKREQRKNESALTFFLK